jgi:hypothetical protein
MSLMTTYVGRAKVEDKKNTKDMVTQKAAREWAR